MKASTRALARSGGRLVHKSTVCILMLEAELACLVCLWQQRTNFGQNPWERYDESDRVEVGFSVYVLRQEDGADANASREVMLLPISGDEMVEAEFHHGDMQQISGLDRNGLAVFAGKFQCNVEHFVVVHFEAGQNS